MPIQPDNRPRVLLLIDIKDWAFHTIARSIEKHLGDQFAFTILAVDEHPNIEEELYDIVHIFFEFEEYHFPFLSGKSKVIRSIYSHYWDLERDLSPMGLYQKKLYDADAILVPSIKLLNLFHQLPPPVHLFSEGVDTAQFQLLRHRSGPLTVGWVGRIAPIKRLDLLREACDGICELKVADGKLDTKEMVEFYNDVDVIACTSIAEGCPRPLLEGMACGNFPVSFDVGIASEIIIPNVNGLLVKEETVEGMKTALSWCAQNMDIVRGSWQLNMECMRSTRDWKSTTAYLADIYLSLLKQ